LRRQLQHRHQPPLTRCRGGRHHRHTSGAARPGRSAGPTLFASVPAGPPDLMRSPKVGTWNRSHVKHRPAYAEPLA
jgi:hypothetical protein